MSQEREGAKIILEAKSYGDAHNNTKADSLIPSWQPGESSLDYLMTRTTATVVNYANHVPWPKPVYVLAVVSLSAFAIVDRVSIIDHIEAGFMCRIC